MPTSDITIPNPDSAPTFPTYTEVYLQKWYRISRERFDSMLNEQKGCCWVCQRSFGPGVKLNIDHDQSCCNTKGWEKKAHPRAAEGIDYCCGKCARVLLCS